LVLGTALMLPADESTDSRWSEWSIPIDIETYAEKLREELTLARIDVTPASSKNST
jgi:hypothetical protein